MPTTFMTPPSKVEDRSGQPQPSFDFRFSDIPTLIPRGRGEHPDAKATPFARFAARTSFPITGDGASVVASAATDTSTNTGGRVDDSNLDDR